MEGEQTLFVQDDTGNYVEYTPPEPPAFHETLPEDLRESEHLKEVENSADLARYYVDLKSNYLKPPDSPDGYEFEKPEGFELDDEMFKAFKQSAFDNGINQQQFAEIMNLEVKRNQQALEAVNRQIDENQAEAVKKLKEDWGDRYEEKLDSAKRFLRHEGIADENFIQFLEDTKLGDSPEVIRFFAKLSDLISEDALVKPGTGDKAGGPRVGEDGRPMLSFPTMQGDK